MQWNNACPVEKIFFLTNKQKTMGSLNLYVPLAINKHTHNRTTTKSLDSVLLTRANSDGGKHIL